jgi:ribosomal protein S18 acetylase RimI-like enzyme
MMPKEEKSLEEVEVRTASVHDAQAVHDVLRDSFEPFREQYTEEAYNITIMTPAHIRERMDDEGYDVLVAYLNGKLVGTAILQYRVGDVYLHSMAVKPAAQGRGVGRKLLVVTEERARQKNCKTITLECFEPLKRAVFFYEKAKFQTTGKKRRYYGIETFEMTKEL